MRARSSPERLSDEQVLALMRTNSQWNDVRKLISNACAKMQQMDAQRIPWSPIEHRRHEFETAAKIALALGVRLETPLEEVEGEARRRRG